MPNTAPAAPPVLDRIAMPVGLERGVDAFRLAGFQRFERGLEAAPHADAVVAVADREIGIGQHVGLVDHRLRYRHQHVAGARRVECVRHDRPHILE